MKTKQQHLWYIRRDGEVSGPFPVGQILQYLLLGRFCDTDEASTDQLEWQVLADIAEFERPAEKSELDNARRWADERQRERRVDNIEERSGADRRQGESLPEQVSRAAREMLMQHFRQTPLRGIKAGLMVFGAMVAVIGILLLLTPQRAMFDEKCSAPPVRGVDWSHCDLVESKINQANLSNAILTGAHLHGASILNSSFMYANLQYVDLGHASVTNVSFSRASMKGSDFRQAMLLGINFIGTDLSYADFRGAKLIDVNLSEARLDFAIWPDGRVCQEGSIETCR